MSADVTLHEEHAELMRRVIDDPKYVGNIDWADSEIEVIETAEHAIVNKSARIVERQDHGAQGETPAAKAAE